MLLIHDLVEIYAGDTFCYDKIANGDKKDREKIAAEKIFGLLEEDKGEEFKALWEEFEAMETPEAKFSASMDRLQPMLNNYNNGGGTWKEYSLPSSLIVTISLYSGNKSKLSLQYFKSKPTETTSFVLSYNFAISIKQAFCNAPYTT